MNNKRHSVLLAMSVALALSGCALESGSDSAEGPDTDTVASPAPNDGSGEESSAYKGHWPGHWPPHGSTTGAGTSAGSSSSTSASTSAGAGGAGTGSGSGSSTSAGSGGAGGAGGGGSCAVFPADNWWNKDISGAAVDPKSATYVATIGAGTSLHPDFGTQYGIPWVKVDASVAKSTVTFDYDSESDVGPYPIPANPPVESGSDHHILMLHTGECKLYELFDSSRSGSQWHAGSGAIWDLTKNSTRPKGWTSADAAGLPIYPGLVRYEEVAAGVINHALRFTVPNTQHGYVAPASHYASSSYDTSRPPMGVRFRLKASFDISGYSAQMKVILTALKKYGMFLADNGGAWYLSGAPSPSWDDNAVNTLKQVHGSDFEAITTGAITTN
jgi:hypothetical protein